MINMKYSPQGKRYRCGKEQSKDRFLDLFPSAWISFSKVNTGWTSQNPEIQKPKLTSELKSIKGCTPLLQLCVIIVFCLWANACSAPIETTEQAREPATQKTMVTDRSPKRIISLDFCSDQYVLQLAKRSSIIALSSDAMAEFSYFRDQAKGIATLENGLEQVLLLKPDLIVRSYGGGPHADRFFQRLGIPVLNLQWTDTLDQVKANIHHIARGLNNETRGLEMIRSMERRQKKIIASIRDKKTKPTLLYVTPTGYTTGPGSLVAESIVQAGYQNYITKPGWHPLPLERLVKISPDHIAASFFDLQKRQPANWSTIRHPVAKSLLKTVPRTALDGAWTACGASFIMDAIEALAINQTLPGQKDNLHD